MTKTIQQLEQELYYTEHYIIEARAKADDEFAEMMETQAQDLTRQIDEKRNQSFTLEDNSD